MKCFMRHILTGIDGESYDIARVVWAIGSMAYVVLAVADLFVRGNSFNPQEYGVGFGALMAGGGAAVSLKAKTEPGATNESP